MWPFKKERKYPEDYSDTEITETGKSLLKRFGYTKLSSNCFLCHDFENTPITNVTGKITKDGIIVLCREFENREDIMSGRYSAMDRIHEATARAIVELEAEKQ